MAGIEEIWKTCSAFCEHGWKSDVCIKESERCSAEIRKFKGEEVWKKLYEPKCDFFYRTVDDPRVGVYTMICKGTSRRASGK